MARYIPTYPKKPVTEHESHDDYSHVVVRDGRKRIIACKDAMQWIIQRQGSPNSVRGWVAAYFCRTRKGLQLYAPPELHHVVDTLPEFFPEGDYLAAGCRPNLGHVGRDLSPPLPN